MSRTRTSIASKRTRLWSWTRRPRSNRRTRRARRKPTCRPPLPFEEGSGVGDKGPPLTPSPSPPRGEGSKSDGLPIAVTPDLRESENLETFTDDQLDQRLGFTPVHLTAGVSSGSATLTERL